MLNDLKTYKLDVAQSVVDDLMDRLAKARWPDEAPDQTQHGHWRYGTPVHWLQKLHRYWIDEFDWRAQEDKLNAFEQWKLKLETIDLISCTLKANIKAPNRFYCCMAGRVPSLSF